MDKDMELLQVYCAAQTSQCRNAQWARESLPGKREDLPPRKRDQTGANRFS